MAMGRALGRYELIRKIASGGMADVFLARMRSLGGIEKKLVIKRIRSSQAQDPRFVDLFVKEAYVSMSLVHKNIVSVFDFGRADDKLFLVMELVDGGDLATMMRRARAKNVRLDAPLVAYVAMEACAALEYAHHLPARDGGTIGVIHRDITPSNLLLSRSGEVKVVDFGIASVSNDLRGQGRVRGTPAYMSPEQARGATLDGRSDLFSLGLVMWEALSGQRAYDSQVLSELMTMARAGQVPPLTLADHPRVPRELAAIVQRATHSEPAERYRDARAMQLALDQYLVSTRADGGGLPPSHHLAAWMGEHCPSSDLYAFDDTWDGEPVTPEVLTFLENGDDVMMGSRGSSTIRSIAETIMETGLEAHDEGGRSTNIGLPKPTGRAPTVAMWPVPQAESVTDGPRDKGGGEGGGDADDSTRGIGARARGADDLGDTDSTTQSVSTQSASTQSASTQSASTQSASTQSVSTQSASTQSVSISVEGGGQIASPAEITGLSQKTRHRLASMLVALTAFVGIVAAATYVWRTAGNDSSVINARGGEQPALEAPLAVPVAPGRGPERGDDSGGASGDASGDDSVGVGQGATGEGVAPLPAKSNPTVASAAAPAGGAETGADGDRSAAGRGGAKSVGADAAGVANGGKPSSSHGSRAKASSSSSSSSRGQRKPGKPRAKADPGASNSSALAQLKISSAPWARVDVIAAKTGKLASQCPETPCVVDVRPGVYVVELENPVAGLRKSTRVGIAAGETKVVQAVLKSDDK